MEWSTIVLLITPVLTIVDGGEPTLIKSTNDPSQVFADSGFAPRHAPQHLQYGGKDQYGRPDFSQQVQLPQQTPVYGAQRPLMPGGMPVYANSNISTSQMMSPEGYMTQQLHMPTGMPTSMPTGMPIGMPTTGTSVGAHFGLTPTVPQSNVSIGAHFGLTPSAPQSTVPIGAHFGSTHTVPQSHVPGAAYNPVTSYNPSTSYNPAASYNPNPPFVQNAGPPQNFGGVYPPPIRTHPYNNTAYNQQVARYR